MLDSRLLRAFIAIADTGSFTLAADRLNMTQSTISQQLGRLEQSIGNALIDRTARPVQPTACGERLLGYARRILSLQNEAEAVLSNPAGTVSLRIGLPEDIVTVAMANTFADFARKRREIRLDVVAGLSRDLTKRYREGEFDIVVVKEPAPHSDACATFVEAMGWFESAEAPDEWPDPIPLVTFPPGGLYRETMFSRIEQEKKHWYVAFSGSSLHNVLVAVEAGLGLSLLPVGTTIGRHLLPCSRFGPEPSMAVSVYSREKAGPVAELVGLINTALGKRFTEAASE